MARDREGFGSVYHGTPNSAFGAYVSVTRDPQGYMIKGYGANAEAADADRIRQEEAYKRRHENDD